MLQSAHIRCKLINRISELLLSTYDRIVLRTGNPQPPMAREINQLEQRARYHDVESIGVDDRQDSFDSLMQIYRLFLTPMAGSASQLKRSREMQQSRGRVPGSRPQLTTRMATRAGLPPAQRWEVGLASTRCCSVNPRCARIYDILRRTTSKLASRLPLTIINRSHVHFYYPQPKKFCANPIDYKIQQCLYTDETLLTLSPTAERELIDQHALVNTSYGRVGWYCRSQHPFWSVQFYIYLAHAYANYA